MNRLEGDWYHPADRGDVRAVPGCGRRLFKGGSEVRETEEERQLASIAAEMDALYKRDYAPVEDRIFASMLDVEPERRQGLGIAAAESTRAMQDARQRGERSLTQTGARPGSGRFNTAMGGLATARSVATGLNLADVNQSVSDSRIRALDSITSVGRGQQGRAVGGLASLASQASQQAQNDAVGAANDRALLLQAGATAAGLGYGSLKPKLNAADEWAKNPSPFGGG
jgi:hypothetical protein